MYVGKQLQVFKSFFSLILECNSVNKMFCELFPAAQFSNIPTKCGYYVSFRRTSLFWWVFVPCSRVDDSKLSGNDQVQAIEKEVHVGL